MIRFVDLTPWYWTDPDDSENSPVCAFFDTVVDRFVENDGYQTFFGPDDIEEIGNVNHRERCRALVPDGFWGKR